MEEKRIEIPGTHTEIPDVGSLAEQALSDIEHFYGVKLTNYQFLRLRELVRQVIERYIKTEQDIRSGAIGKKQRFVPAKEILALWPDFEYKYDYRSIPKKLSNEDKVFWEMLSETGKKRFKGMLGRPTEEFKQLLIKRQSKRED